MLQVLIIGGGIHGVHLAHRLLHDTWLTHDDIRIPDPSIRWQVICTYLVPENLRFLALPTT